MQLEHALLIDTLGNLPKERAAILVRKGETLLRECRDYLTLSLLSAEGVASDRHSLKSQVIGERELIDGVKSQIHLVVRNTAAGTRTFVAQQLEKHQHLLERRLLQQFASLFPTWHQSLATMLTNFEAWLADSLRRELTSISVEERRAFLGPLRAVERQAIRALQQFRDRLSERTQEVFGVPLRTSETEIRVAEPSTPNVRIGRVFDRNWELLSPILPVWAIEKVVQRHFERRIPYLIYQNLSRLSTQWEESIHEALRMLDKEAQRRLDELIVTVERLVETADDRVPQLRNDLDRLRAANEQLVQENAD